MSNLNIENSWKTITLVPDFMNEVLNLLDYKETLKDIVRLCGLETQEDKDLLLYALYSYSVKAYKSKAQADFVINKEQEILSYLDGLIKYYNELTESNYNALHKEMWYLSYYRNIVKDVDILEKIQEITCHELFDECELEHKCLFLNFHIQVMLEQDASDFDMLMQLNERLKVINEKIKQEHNK